jgi:hypothetical protein
MKNAGAVEAKLSRSLLLQAEEERLGKTVMAVLLEKPAVTPWMFLIPLLIVPYMSRLQRHKQLMDAFFGGYMFTKQLALQVTMAACREDLSHELAMSIAREVVVKDRRAPAHIQEIYIKQLNEIEVLVQHYSRLINACGETKAELVRHAYGNGEEYLRFLRRLREAEQCVNQAALGAVSGDEAQLARISASMEAELSSLRENEAREIFGVLC